MNPLLQQWTVSAGPIPPFFVGMLFAFGLLDVILKAWALWRAARLSRPYWFVVLILVNSLGILPTFFLLLTGKDYARLELSMARRKQR